MKENDVRFTPAHMCNTMARLAVDTFGKGHLWIDPCQGDGRLPEAMVRLGEFSGGHDIYSYQTAAPKRTFIPEEPEYAMRAWMGTATVQNMKIGLLLNPPFSSDFMERLARWIVSAGPLCIGGVMLHRSDVLHQHSADPWRWLVSEAVAIRGRVRFDDPFTRLPMGSPQFSSSLYILRPKGPAMRVVESAPKAGGDLGIFGALPR